MQELRANSSQTSPRLRGNARSASEMCRLGTVRYRSVFRASQRGRRGAAYMLRGVVWIRVAGEGQYFVMATAIAARCPRYGQYAFWPVPLRVGCRSRGPEVHLADRAVVDLAPPGGCPSVVALRPMLAIASRGSRRYRRPSRSVVRHGLQRWSNREARTQNPGRSCGARILSQQYTEVLRALAAVEAVPVGGPGHQPRKGRPPWTP